MGEGWIWDRLGIDPTNDPGGIRRAYAQRLKSIDPDADPNAFIELRQARDAALAHALAAAAEAGPDAGPAYEPPQGPPRAEGEWRAPDGPAEEQAEDQIVTRRPAEEESVAGEAEPPALPVADLERVDALLFEGAAPAHPGELEQLTVRILADPAAEQIDVARWLEGWTAERIAHGMPRSDPMIEPAIAHFRWDDDTAELNRPPIIDWILQRREDRQFEAELVRAEGPYFRLTRLLRRPATARPNKLIAWWRGVRVEYLFAYLRTLNPTVMTRIDPDTIAWWDAHIAAQAGTGGLAQQLREWRRKRVWEDGIYGSQQPVSVLLAIGILFMPYIFGWFLFRRGYSPLARVVGLGWLGFVLISLLATPAPPPQQGFAPNDSSASIPPPEIRYENIAEDLGSLVAWVTEGRTSLQELGETEPRLEATLADRWWEARERNENPQLFAVAVTGLLHDFYCAKDASFVSSNVCAAIRTPKPDILSTPPTAARAPVFARYRGFKPDVGPILSWVTQGKVNLQELEKSNYVLHARLKWQWSEASESAEDPAAFSRKIVDMLDDAYGPGVRGGGYELQWAHWRLRADRAIWARGRDAALCDTFLSSDRQTMAGEPEALRFRAEELKAQALLAPAGYGSPRSGTRLFNVPEPVLTEAARRSGLNRQTLVSALGAGGTAAQRCNARIALIETALDRSNRMSKALLHTMSARM